MSPLRDLIARAMARISNPRQAGAILTSLASVPVAPAGTIACVACTGSTCPVCKGTGHETAPDDLPGWIDRARRCNRAAHSTLIPVTARGCREQEARAWGMVYELTDRAGKGMALRSAVLAFNLAELPAEARLIVIECQEFADAFTLSQVGDVGAAILLRRRARAKMARLGPTAYPLDVTRE